MDNLIKFSVESHLKQHHDVSPGRKIVYPLTEFILKSHKKIGQRIYNYFENENEIVKGHFSSISDGFFQLEQAR